MDTQETDRYLEKSLAGVMDLHVFRHVRQLAAFKHYTAERDLRRQVRGRGSFGGNDEVKAVRRARCQAVGVGAADDPARSLTRDLALRVEQEADGPRRLHFLAQVVLQRQRHHRPAARHLRRRDSYGELRLCRDAGRQ